MRDACCWFVWKVFCRRSEPSIKHSSYSWSSTSNPPGQSRSVSYLQQHTPVTSPVCLSSCRCVSVIIAVLCFTTSLRRYHTKQLQHSCWLSFKMWLSFEPYHAANLKNMQIISKGTHTGSAKCPSKPSHPLSSLKVLNPQHLCSATSQMLTIAVFQCVTRA